MGNVLFDFLVFPDVGQRTPEQALQQLETNQFLLAEQLRYMLANLGAENFNRVSLAEITAPIYGQIEDRSAKLATLISATAQGIMTEVQDRENDLSTRITQNADEIEAIVTAVGEDGEVSAASIVAAINAQTGQSTVQISADMVDLTGYLTVTDVGSTGTTVIDGSRIQTGSITAARLGLAGNMPVYDSNAEDQSVMGYIQGLVTDNVAGLGLYSENKRYSVLLANSNMYIGADLLEMSYHIEIDNSGVRIYEPTGSYLKISRTTSATNPVKIESYNSNNDLCRIFDSHVPS